MTNNHDLNAGVFDTLASLKPDALVKVGWTLGNGHTDTTDLLAASSALKFAIACASAASALDNTVTFSVTVDGSL